MCGIVGVVEFDGRPVDEQLLDRMVGTLAHRGPDRQATQQVQGVPAAVGLGHTRLRVVDLSEAAGQPMANEDRSIWLVFNGEIYNFRELRAQLAARGATFRTTSDTEVLLRLYEAEGERCVEALDGMFAFAVWDGRAQSLLLARDRLGKKPLFYYTDPQRFVFASEIKALRQHPGVRAEVDAGVLPAFFLCGYVPTPRTFYRGVHALEPGHYMRVQMDGTIRLGTYWEAPVADRVSRTRPTEHQAVERVRELATDAVRKRLIADVPLGAFLSGGLDSSIVVGVMSRLMREPVRTFSIGFSGDPYFDERRYARLASAQFGTVHTEFVVEPKAVELIDTLVWHHDGPFADSSAIPTYLLAKLTREHVTVALTGDGGDELFAGYLRFYAAILAEQLPAWVRTAAHWGLSGLPDWGGHRGLFRRLQKFARGASLPLTERYSFWSSIFYEDLPRLLPGYEHDGQPSPAVKLLEPLLERASQASPLTKLLHVNLKTYLLDDLLVKVDRCSMAHGLEVRSPLLDRALTEYVIGLPDAMKLSRGGSTKVVLRKAFADLLPRKINTRGKMGFGVPLRKWFASDLRDYLQDLLLAPDARLRRYLDQRYVRQLYREHLSWRADHSHRLWTLLTFEVWLRGLAKGSTGRPATQEQTECLEGAT